MGNYYKSHPQFGKKPQRKKAVFWGGVVVVLLLVLVQFTTAGDSLKTGLARCSASIATAFQGAKDWGQGKFGSEHASFAVPVSSGVVVEDFGVVADAEGNEAYHKGIDIQVPADSEILAAADGVVADVSKHEDETYWITLKHEKHWSTIYGRLGETALAVGDEVKKGDVLGKPAGEILHFEVLEDEIEKDPVRYFNSGTEE